MKPTDHDQSWARLTAGARRAPRGDRDGGEACGDVPYRIPPLQRET